MTKPKKPAAWRLYQIDDGIPIPEAQETKSPAPRRHPNGRSPLFNTLRALQPGQSFLVPPYHHRHAIYRAVWELGGHTIYRTKKGVDGRVRVWRL